MDKPISPLMEHKSAPEPHRRDDPQGSVLVQSIAKIEAELERQQRDRLDEERRFERSLLRKLGAWLGA